MRVRVASLTVLCLAVATLASAQRWQPPADSERCPSKWGPQDQRGAGNHMKPETVLKAARLIKTGEVFELGRVLSDTMPLPAGRRFEVVSTTVSAARDAFPEASSTAPLVAPLPKLAQPPAGLSGCPQGHEMTPLCPGRQFIVIGPR